MGKDIVLLILGWLMGTLSPGVISAIAARKRRRAIQDALATELHELRFDAALAFARHRGARASFDSTDMELVRPVINAYRGGLHATTMDRVREVLSRGDEAFVLAQNTVKPGVTRYPVKYEAPFLAAHLGDLLLLPPDRHRAALQVLREIRMYNEKADFVRQCHDRTFDGSLSQENATKNVGNLDQGVADLAVRLEFLVRAISELVEVSGGFRTG